MERKLLYVGMTRATERLYMSLHGEPSKFLRDIDGTFLKLQDSSLIRNYYRLPVQEYLFMDRIPDPYGKEEQVRQWLIRELMGIYKYPVSLINIEYRVQAFSQTGYVDVVVCINRNNQMLPYIIVELKQRGYELESAIGQVKSYMAVIPSCCYAIVSNGDEFHVYNRNNEQVDDIPMFDNSMLPTSVKNYKYVDINRNVEHKFMMDSENTSEIVVEEYGQEITLKGNRLVKIPVFTSIAAGAPIELVDEMTDVRYMPYDWLANHLETFMLKVRGDSMVNARIDDGDYILIQKQASADNGQIVAVEVDGNTTLKRLRMMGSMVLLIPENQEYEPIAVSADQVRIIGVAVGVVKKVIG